MYANHINLLLLNQDIGISNKLINILSDFEEVKNLYNNTQGLINKHKGKTIDHSKNSKIIFILRIIDNIPRFRFIIIS